MSGNLRKWLDPSMIFGDLGSARVSLSQSIPLRFTERRMAARLAVRHRPTPAWVKAGTLLNLSRRGLAVKIPAKCVFARGEFHRLKLRAGSGTVAVEGRVCWTQSRWEWIERSRRGPDLRYFQVAGFSLVEDLSPESKAILDILRRLVREVGVTVQVEASEVIRKCGKDLAADMTH